MDPRSEPPPTDPAPPNPWREELDGMLAALPAALDRWLQPWVDAEEAEALTAAAVSLDRSGLLSGIAAGLTPIERWYRRRAEETLAEAEEELGVSDPRLRAALPGSGWLRGAAAAELAELGRAATDLQGAADAVARFSTENSGFTGLARNFARGVADPLDGLAGLFGESTVDREATRLDAELRRAGAVVDTAMGQLWERVDHAVVDRWNEEVFRGVEALRAEAERRAREEAERLAREEAERLAREEAERLAREEAERQSRADAERLAHDAAGRPAPTSAAPAARRPMGAWLGAAGVVLLLVVGGAFVWAGRDPVGPAPAATLPAAEAATLGIVPAGTSLRAGPGAGFDEVVRVDRPTPVRLLDTSVPGWVKVVETEGHAGWVPAEALER